jgi:hypothetical protein
VIRAPQRLEIGGLSARIYSEEEAEEIEREMKPRIAYGGIMAPTRPPVRKQQAGP